MYLFLKLLIESVVGGLDRGYFDLKKFDESEKRTLRKSESRYKKEPPRSIKSVIVNLKNFV